VLSNVSPPPDRALQFAFLDGVPFPEDNPFLRICGLMSDGVAKAAVEHGFQAKSAAD